MTILKERQEQHALELVEIITGKKHSIEQLKENVEITKEFIDVFNLKLADKLSSEGNLYYACQTGFPFFNIYVVSKYEEDFEEELANAKEGYLWAYVYNYDNPGLSEFGTIKVDKDLNRIY
ncbi:hypothetical protein ACTQXV_03310 [Ligilactobacillus salivarius]|uniref:hypothetical protein n=1 Tax=Ligilactobacillus salivarius TaxID=1624 RepID=UPI003F961975